MNKMRRSLQQHLANSGRRCGLNGQWRQCSLVAIIMLCNASVTGICWGQIISADKGNSVKEQLFHQHDSGPEAMEIIKARGFIGEQYVVTSKDNTPLSVYHIINPLADQRTLNRYPVLMFHGVAGDAAQMLSHSDLVKPRKPIVGQITYDRSDTSLAFMLSNNNFDVYMVDARGTNLNNHRVADDINLLMGQKYWNFSLDEQIFYDLTTLIDFVLKQTHEDKLHYIGFSESTIFMFALLSTVSSYHNKLASFVAMAPVAYINNISGTTLTVFAPAALIPESVNGNYIPQLMTDTTGTLLKQICQFEPLTRTMCLATSSSYSGVGSNELSHGFYATNFKSTSIKAVRHFMQLYLHKRFGMYDYGPEGNMRMYGQLSPPRYDLGRIKLPTIILFRGAKDTLSDPADQARLIRELGVKPYLDFNFPHYNHIDFLVSKNIIFDVNLPAVQAMFHLLKQQAAGGFLRSPAKMLLPKRHKPATIVVPDGSRKLEIKSNIVNNLINTFTETLSNQIVDTGNSGISTGPLIQSHLKQPLMVDALG